MDTTAVTARPIMPDGTAYIEQMTSSSVHAWFTFRIEPNHSYAIETWNPYGGVEVVVPPVQNGNRCWVQTLYEKDGTTFISTVDRLADPPAPMVDGGVIQGSRQTFVASGTARPVSFEVTEAGAAPASPTNCALRVVDTTLASMRWSVNGYTDYIAISNIGTTYMGQSFAPGGTLSGQVLYFNEAGALVGSDPFTLGSDASVQIVKPAGVAIGGAMKGGIRIVHDGAPGALLAHQLWYNPVTNAYVQYPFYPLAQSYSRGGMPQ